MTLVYRVENEDGEGMYSGRKNLHEYPDFEHDDYSHPMPSNRMLSHSFSGYLFGFESLIAAKNWLYEIEWTAWLDYQGYKISVYELEDEDIYKEDSQQLVFFNIIESEGDCCIRSEPIKRLSLKELHQ